MQAVLQVPHYGYPKMVGKVFTLQTTGGPRNVFLHEEVKGDQGHYLAESPGGIDWCVIRRLQDWQIETVFHKVRRTDRILVTATKTLADLGVRHDQDGRKRTFLPWGNWQDWPRTLVIPWIPASSIIVLNPNDDYQQAQATTQTSEDGELSPTRRTRRRQVENVDERHHMHAGSYQVSLWQPRASHPCPECGRPTAQEATCVICQGEAWAAGVRA
jgi:hypothetical protein